MIHLDALLHERLFLLHLFVTLISLLHHSLLEAVQLSLSHFFRVVCVVRQQQQLFVITLLRFQRSLYGGKLVVEAA
jgi:hypothetical protein